MAATLSVSDGTTTISLITAPGTAGVHLGGDERGWIPQTPRMKESWQNPPMATGRQLVGYQYENVVDTFDVHIHGASQDACIVNTQNLRRLLVRAADYFASDWQGTPVYLIAQASSETNARYAIIHKAELLTDDAPFICRFMGSLAWMWHLSLVVEHGIWTENAPGTGTAVCIGAHEAYDSRYYGNVDDSGTYTPTTANEVFIANKRNTAQLTDVYVDDGGAWTTNRLDAALDYNLLPAVPVANDAVYFGIDTSLTNSGPFCSLVFDIGTAGVDYTAAWEYWSGAAWSTLTVTDHTAAVFPFDTTGVHGVHWSQPNGWATRDISNDGGPAITGYFVRCRVTAVGTPTGPVQQNRNPYTVTWPYVEILDTAVLGDIPALLRLGIYNQSADASPARPYHASRVICGLRSYSRGANFTAYLNAADEQNPSGITVTDGANTTLTADIGTPTGWKERYSHGFTGTEYAVTWTFTSALAAHYYGSYHAFVRYTWVAGDGDELDINLQVLTGTGGTAGQVLFSSPTISTLETTGSFRLMDFGKIQIPPSGIISTGDAVDQLAIRLRVEQTEIDTVTVDFFDLVLIPVDEWACDCQDGAEATTSLLTENTYLDIDSIVYPKQHNRALIRYASGASADQVITVWQANQNGPGIMQANAQQRLWVLAELLYETSTGTKPGSYYYLAHSVLAYRQQRYLSQRGNR